MCGIIGYIGEKNVSEILIDGLRKLEYRGYDSAGIAVISAGKIKCIRSVGKIKALENLVSNNVISKIGIGHTRWATHGVPSEENSHPLSTENVAVIHNGIIENYLELRLNLEAQKVIFKSQTDTEVITNLIDLELKKNTEESEIFGKILPKLQGAYAFVAMFKSSPDTLYAAKHGAPLLIGIGENEIFLASDAYAIAAYTNKICYLEDGEYAVIKKDKFTIYNLNKEEVKREITTVNITNYLIGKENFQHFMQKEIFEQPICLADNLNTYVSAENNLSFNELEQINLKDIDKIIIIACGTSYYAGMSAKYWFEEIAKIPVEIDIASEFRYRNPIISDKNLYIFISQSGETIDTLSALKLVNEKKAITICILNTIESSMGRIANAVLPIYAGLEVGVASTKAFTSQLMTLALFLLYFAKNRNNINEMELNNYVNLLKEVPGRIANIFHLEPKIKEIAINLSHCKNILFIGRNILYPIALEGSLKLKELSYIHSEAIAAGELKHGTIALIDEEIPTIALCPSNILFDKMLSNMQEIMARRGKVIAITDSHVSEIMSQVIKDIITIPKCDKFIAPFIYVIPLQLLSYHIAVIKGTDVDQPRNLAKSVTVE